MGEGACEESLKFFVKMDESIAVIPDLDARQTPFFDSAKIARDSVYA